VKGTKQLWYDAVVVAVVNDNQTVGWLRSRQELKDPEQCIKVRRLRIAFIAASGFVGPYVQLQRRCDVNSEMSFCSGAAPSAVLGLCVDAALRSSATKLRSDAAARLRNASVGLPYLGHPPSPRRVARCSRPRSVSCSDRSPVRAGSAAARGAVI
jgi:hypothetical protein